MKIITKLIAHPLAPLLLAFLALNLLVTQDGGQNAKSRLLAMRSFGDGAGGFFLNDHIRVTDDWALAPSGNYYSNKAPGALLLGFPIFFLADKFHQLSERGFRDERGLRHDPGYLQNTASSIFMQAIPYALLVGACWAWLGAAGIGFGGLLYFGLAALFGNTSILFMNSYFGHGFTALLQLGGIYFLLRRRYGYSGLLFSFSLLSDYGFAVQIPAMLAALWMERPSRRELFHFAWGSLPGAFLWVSYHTLAFGSPLAIASRFQNPVFVDSPEAGEKLWGILSFPRGEILGELVVGGARGLVLSQPWLFLLLPLGIWLIWQKRSIRPTNTVGVFAVMSLGALLLMNSSFNGWHGGGTAGPRYLSGVLPIFALWGAWIFEKSPKPAQWCLWIALGVGLFFRSLVYGSTILAPNEALWPFYWRELLSRPTPMVRFALFWLILSAALIWAHRRYRNSGFNFASGA